MSRSILVTLFAVVLGVGTVSAVAAQPVDAGVTLVDAGPGSANPAPADKLHDPVLDPGAAFDDARAMQKLGWPLAVIGVLVMLARGLLTAGKKWPDVKWLAWLNTGSRAFMIAGVLTVGSAGFNTLALGGTWFAVAVAAGGALLALMAPVAPPKAPA